jgi:RNA polymerase sigma-32 factor
MHHTDALPTQRANLRFIKASMRERMLTREDEVALARRWREAGEIEALHTLVRSHTRLVVAVAARFRRYGLPRGDLMQEGCIGLMQAAGRFEPAHGVRFSTYAKWWVRSAMQDYVLRNWSIVRIGTTSAQKALFFNLRRLQSRIETAGGDLLASDQRRRIAVHLKVPEVDVEAMEIRLAGADHSLDAPINGASQDAWQDFLADDRPDQEIVVNRVLTARRRARWVKAALDRLDPRERRIIVERCLSEEKVTLDMLGQALGITKERVRQLEQRAMGKMREALSREVGHYRELFVES